MWGREGKIRNNIGWDGQSPHTWYLKLYPVGYHPDRLGGERIAFILDFHCTSQGIYWNTYQSVGPIGRWQLFKEKYIFNCQFRKENEIKEKDSNIFLVFSLTWATYKSELPHWLVWPWQKHGRHSRGVVASSLKKPVEQSPGAGFTTKMQSGIANTDPNVLIASPAKRQIYLINTTGKVYFSNIDIGVLTAICSLLHNLNVCACKNPNSFHTSCLTLVWNVAPVQSPYDFRDRHSDSRAWNVKGVTYF